MNFEFCRKKGYDSYEGAATAAKRAVDFATDTDRLRLYFCQWCQKWHMTKQMKKRETA